MNPVPRRQRVAAYAVILREGTKGLEILLSKISPRIVRHELWTLPGGGLEHGEDPRSALLREIWEETGLDAQIGDRPDVLSSHRPEAEFDGVTTDFHALRIVFDAWTGPDAPAPQVMERNGSTVAARWHLLADVNTGAVPVSAVVTEALELRGPMQRQRISAYALVEQDGAILLTQLSERSPHPGAWTLPGGGLEHGESPEAALKREFAEETGLEMTIGALLGVHDVHFTGTAPSGQVQEFHGVHLVHAGSVPQGASPQVVEVDGSTEKVAWVDIAAIEAGEVEVLDVVRFGLERR